VFVKVLIESSARDSRQLDHVGDLGRLVSALGADRDHRSEEALALAA
jgi:hypothetical protein